MPLSFIRFSLGNLMQITFLFPAIVFGFITSIYLLCTLNTVCCCCSSAAVAWAPINVCFQSARRGGADGFPQSLVQKENIGKSISLQKKVDGS
jgi:hypothetical protein